MKSKIQKYYENCNLWLPKYSNWRQFKFRLDNGRMIQIKDQIRDVETLRKWLLKYKPIDAYYSSGCFLNPSQVRGKLNKGVMLFRNIPFDIDEESDLELARQTTENLIKEILLKLDKEPEYILFTGKKGFQVVYEFNSLTDNEILTLKSKGIDQEVTTDKYRVIRLPLTINKSGKVACFLTMQELKKGMDYILKKSQTIYSPQDCGDRAARRKPMTESLKAKVNGKVSGTAQTEPSRAIYVSNEVKGTKRFIPILKYNYKEISTSNPNKDLKKLNEMYGLNEWFMIKTEFQLFCISLACFDKRRLKKILNNTTSLSAAEFEKLGKIYFRTSSMADGEDPPLPVGIVYFQPSEKKFLYSKPHSDVMQFFDFKLNPFHKYIGHTKPRILLTVKK